MEIRFQSGGPDAWKAKITLTFALEGQKAMEACPELGAGAPWLEIAPAWADFTGKSDSRTLLYGPPGMDLPRVMVLGLGKADKLDAQGLRFAIGAAARKCRDLRLDSLALDLPALFRACASLGFSEDFLAREAVLSVLLGLYRYDKWLTDKSGCNPDPELLSLFLNEKFVPDAMRDAMRLAEAEAAGLYLARDLANGPANEVYPRSFAAVAQNMAEKYGFACRILDRAQMEAEQMGLLLGVAAGSEREPCLVVLEYKPKACELENPLILVGKGITFDSGGISLKPAAGMAEMRGDMSGAAAVLGVFEALGQLAGRQPKRPLVALIPLTENMPDGKATRPGDILIGKSGTSVEITNTDAEGRLILADALTYAQTCWQPAQIIDIATLTGACVVALGKDAAGLFCNDDEFCSRLYAIGNLLGERNWRLPIWDTSKKALKSNVADMVNAGSREGGALHAAYFLKCFVKNDKIWAHLDIAATDHTESQINAEGASGFGVRTLLEYALHCD